MKVLNYYQTSVDNWGDFTTKTFLVYSEVDIVAEYRGVFFGHLGASKVLVYNGVIVCERGSVTHRLVDCFLDSSLCVNKSDLYLNHTRLNNCYKNALKLLKLKGIKL